MELALLAFFVYFYGLFRYFSLFFGFASIAELLVLDVYVRVVGF